MTMAAMCGKNSEGVRRLSGKRLFIYCAGGLGRDVLKMARYINRQQGRWEEVFFIDDHFTSGEMNTQMNLSLLMARQCTANRFTEN